MRYRIKDYAVEVAGNNLILTIPVPSGIDISASAETVQKLIKEAIRLVVDETAGVVFCSSMQKDKYYSHSEQMPSTQNTRLIFAIPSGKTVATTDQFTIEVDFGDEPMSNEIAQFFGLPAALPEGYEFMTAEEVCSTLEDIMISMDLSLTPQQAQAITQQTLTQQ